MPQGICFENTTASALAEAPPRALSLPLSPVKMAAGLAHLPGLVWLDSAQAGPGAVSMIAALPERVLLGSIDSDWTQVDALLKEQARCADRQNGGLYGWVGFDGRFVLGLYPRVLLYSHDDDQWSGSDELASHWRPDGLAGTKAPRLSFEPQCSRGDFLRLVRRAKDYIAAGDIYQVNLSYPWRADWPDEGSPLAAYLKLRAASSAPQAAYLDLNGVQVLSASPELFLRMSGRDIVTRPIKGTRPRFHGNPGLDAAACAELLASAKERAELLMITDLERNDLGQVCEFGSVSVPELWQVEAYPQVFHLVSTVQGTLVESVSHARAFQACFPGGSITGAPKRRALEIIRELEPHPRGLYTGAIGGFGFHGESRWNIAIRTAVREGGALSFHSGAGIVADSDPDCEFEETRHKAAGLLRLADP